MELALVEAAVTEVRIGRQAENGFKRESYVRMQMEVNLQNKGKMLEVLQVKSKLALLKKKFETFAEICRCSGFGWDGVRGMPRADEKTWDTYIAAYPKFSVHQSHSAKNVSRGIRRTSIVRRLFVLSRRCSTYFSPLISDVW
jgi:hypothetical protein